MAEEPPGAEAQRGFEFGFSVSGNCASFWIAVGYFSLVMAGLVTASGALHPGHEGSHSSVRTPSKFRLAGFVRESHISFGSKFPGCVT